MHISCGSVIELNTLNNVQATYVQYSIIANVIIIIIIQFTFDNNDYYMVYSDWLCNNTWS